MSDCETSYRCDECKEHFDCSTGERAREKHERLLGLLMKCGDRIAVHFAVHQSPRDDELTRQILEEMGPEVRRALQQKEGDRA